MQLNISQLPDGIYHHELSELVFRADEETTVTNLYVKVTVDKAFSSLQVKLDTAFSISLLCDRCLENCECKLHNRYSFVYSRSQDMANEDLNDEIRFLPTDQNIIDLHDDICQSIILGTPMKVICKDDCKGLCTVCGINKNKSTCTCNEKTIDPRWESLLNIKVE